MISYKIVFKNMMGKDIYGALYESIEDANREREEDLIQ